MLDRTPDRRCRVERGKPSRLTFLICSLLAACFVGALLAMYARGGGAHTYIEIHLVTGEYRFTRTFGGFEISRQISGAEPFRDYFPDYVADDSFWRPASSNHRGLVTRSASSLSHSGYRGLWLAVYWEFKEHPEQLLAALEALAVLCDGHDRGWRNHDVQAALEQIRNRVLAGQDSASVRTPFATVFA
ncbi:MAG: hypothetical protein AAGG07_11555 [Planctomycetota bacterium]